MSSKKDNAIWAQLQAGDSVYLDARLGFKRGRWTIVKFYEDGFALVRSDDAHFEVTIRGDSVVGWFMNKHRQERSPIPYGVMTKGPRVKVKKARDREERMIEVE